MTLIRPKWLIFLQCPREKQRGKKGRHTQLCETWPNLSCTLVHPDVNKLWFEQMTESSSAPSQHRHCNPANRSRTTSMSIIVLWSRYQMHFSVEIKAPCFPIPHPWPAVAPKNNPIEKIFRIWPLHNWGTRIRDEHLCNPTIPGLSSTLAGCRNSFPRWDTIFDICLKSIA